MKIQTILVWVALSLAVITSGCSSKKEVAAVNTGFFEDYKSIEIQNKTAISKKYTKIKLSPVRVISGISESKQTPSQKKMYKEISEYLNSEYKKIVSAEGYTLADEDAKDTLLLESAISTVEVHFDDKDWNQLSPIAMGVDVISFNAYMYEFVRLLGEMRLVDTDSKKVVSSNINILKDAKILITGDELVFKDVKSGLDIWLKQVKENLQK